MTEQRVITVFGTDGPQGSSAARVMSRDPNIRVRVIVSEPPSQQAQENDQIDTVQCNLNDVYSIKTALDGSHGCFVVTYTDLKDPSCKENEIRLGRLIADACAMAGVSHVVFSTQLHAKRMLSIDVRHLDAKAEIEDYMLEKRLPLTCIMVPCYFEEFLGLFRPVMEREDDYRISLPIGQAPLDMVSIDDIGEVVHKIFLHRDAYLEKTVSICGDKLTVREIAGVLTKHLHPKLFREKQISVNDYKQLDIPGVRDYANMFYFFSRVDQRYNVAATRMINPKLCSFNDWVSQNVDIINRTL